MFFLPLLKIRLIYYSFIFFSCWKQKRTFHIVTSLHHRTDIERPVWFLPCPILLATSFTLQISNFPSLSFFFINCISSSHWQYDVCVFYDIHNMIRSRMESWDGRVSITSIIKWLSHDWSLIERNSRDVRFMETAFLSCHPQNLDKPYVDLLQNFVPTILKTHFLNKT